MVELVVLRSAKSLVKQRLFGIETIKQWLLESQGVYFYMYPRATPQIHPNHLL